MALEDTLKKKLGPLPVGVWILAIGGGLGLSFYMQRGDTDEDTETEDAEEFEFDTFTPQPFSGSVGLPDFGTQAPIPAPSQTIQSNDQWLALGVNHAIATGKNPLTSTNALTKYLGGEALNAQEQAIVSDVIRHLGNPPEGAPSVDDGSVPTPDEPAEDDRGLGTLVWGLSVPVDVRERFGAVQVAIVLGNLGINPGRKYVGANDIKRGLIKLGWSGNDTAPTIENVMRLVNLERKGGASKKPKSRPSNNFRWGAAIPSRAKKELSARAAFTTLKALGVKNSNRIISAGEVTRGLRKLGYKKAKNTRATYRNIKRLLSMRRARKGE